MDTTPQGYRETHIRDTEEESGVTQAIQESTTGDGQPAGPRRHVHLVQVRYADIDPQKHVNNVRMLAYLEDARVSFLRWDAAGGEEDGGLRDGGERDGERPVFGSIVVAHQEADYLAPILLRPDPIRVETWVSEVRRASFTLNYEIRDDSTLFLTASTVLVGFDDTTQRARRLSDAEREFLNRYLAE